MLSGISGSGKFSKTDWIKYLSRPEILFENVEKILKTEGRNCVAVKTLAIGDKRLKAVVKRHCHGLWSLRRGRASRSFDTAVELLNCNIPVTAPLAALQKKGQSIYITRFSEDSVNLYNFISEQLGMEFAVKKELTNQLAAILAALHKNNLWNRDSKATNFIVRENIDGKCEILLVDVDGVKPYCLRRRSQRFRSLWQLAASLLSLSAVNRTDYFRVFSAYCNLTGIAPSQRNRIFRELSDRAEAKYRRSAHKKILIIKPSSLGDIVMALPALSALRQSFPDAEISWFIRPEFAPLIKNHPDLSEVIIFDRRFLGKAWYNPRAFAALVSLIRRLNRSKFDIVLDLQGLFRTASLAWLSGCRKRLGMANARELAHIFYNLKVEQTEDCIHLVDYYLKIVREAGASKTDVQFLLPVDSAAAGWVKKLLKSEGIDGSYAVFVPGSAHADKCWPVERFAALADRVSKQFGLSIAAAGTASEKDVVEELKNKASVPVANLAGATSISELVALLKATRLVVSNDTGPGHIAAALGVPVVLLFGRSNPARVHPYNRPQCAVAIEPDGRGFNADSYDPKHDIKNITVDEVYQKVCEQLR